MANTTNYNWETPDDTDLVKDGAAAIRTLGSSIDTTTKNLNPETTLGDLAYRSATANVKTRLALGTAGQVLRVNSGGNAPEWATTADQTPLTTKGDLFTFSTVDDRLGVGANGTVLTADSAEATGLKWAAASSGALTKIISQQITNSAGYNLDSIFTSTYTNYFITITDCSGSGSADLRIQFRYGSSTQVNTHYKYGGLVWGSGATVTGSENSNDFIIASNNIPNSNSTLYISQVGNTSVKPYFQLNEVDIVNITATANWGLVNEAQTYTGLRFTASSGNVTALVTVYGYQE